ncbi:MAG: hypothetical protein P4M08_15030 [Oligoflexia bacterium]|nr:hypothetical protein [Oligoflexia bacterium]
MKLQRSGLGILTLAFLSACMPSGVQISPVTGTASSQTLASSGTLTISPTSQTVTGGSTLQFTATGGTSPYIFTIASGGGSINSSTGLFTAPTIAATVTVTVIDSSSKGSSASATVTVSSTTSSNSGSLTVSAASSNIAPSSTDQFTASGGVSPYSYSLVAGSGSVSPSTGLYTASSASGSAEIAATDSAGNIAYAIVTISSTGTTSSSSATYSTNYQTTYSQLATYNSNCSSGTPYSDNCNAAIDQYCQKVNGAMSGFGPVENSGNNVTVTCVQSGAGSVIQTTFGILQSYNTGCYNNSVPVSVNCNSAISRYCYALGYASGFGPVEHIGGASATVVCVNSTAATVVNDTFKDLQSYQSECNINTSASATCNSAIKRICQALNHTSGFGIIEDTQTTASWVCVN